MERTKIEWTDLQSNPIKYRDRRTNKVVKHSSGCLNCYSEAIAQRWERGGPYTSAAMKHLTPFLDSDELKPRYGEYRTPQMKSDGGSL